MIIMLLFHIVFGVFSSLISLVNLPDTPIAITQSMTWFINVIAGVFGIFNWVLTPPIVGAVIFVMLFMSSQQVAWTFIMWVVKKIPFLNIK